MAMKEPGLHILVDCKVDGFQWVHWPHRNGTVDLSKDRARLKCPKCQKPATRIANLGYVDTWYKVTGTWSVVPGAGGSDPHFVIPWNKADGIVTDIYSSADIANMESLKCEISDHNPPENSSSNRSPRPQGPPQSTPPDPGNQYVGIDPGRDGHITNGNQRIYDPHRNKGVSESDIAERVMTEYRRDKIPDLPTPLEMARALTTKLLQVPDITFSDSMPGTLHQMLQKSALFHGLDQLPNPWEQGISEFPFIRAIALLHHVVAEPAAMDVPAAYAICVRAINVLQLLLDDKDARTVQNTEVEIQGDLRSILERTWDIAVLLLGATRTRAHLIGENYLEVVDLNFRHAKHYRRSVESALNSDMNNYAICKRGIADITRVEMAPFVRPKELLNFIKELDKDNNQKLHQNCNSTFCDPDVYGKPPPGGYHTPACRTQNPGGCEMIMPPLGSMSAFDSIVNNQRRMPAVRVDAYKENTSNWWLPATRRTLAVSHLWRDGISGTRDGGMAKCLHQYFSDLAKQEKLDSYWIDCATIPEDPRQRRIMIDRINSTFYNSPYSLCMDSRIANIHLAPPDTSVTHERFLLAVITSFWHRRAWTLLEGHKSSEIYFYREDGKHINLKAALETVLIKEPEKTPLWIRACLAEFEVYMTEGLTPEAAGMLLATRKASRKSDSELIWRLLVQPFTAQIWLPESLPNPFHFAGSVDLGFLCSNAERSDETGLCWMPARTEVTQWARQALGGTRAKIVRTVNTHLTGKWYVKYGKADDIDLINWGNVQPTTSQGRRQASHPPPLSQRETAARDGLNTQRDSPFPPNMSALRHLQWKLDSRTFEFILALPVLQEDQESPDLANKFIIMTRPLFKHYTFGQTLLEPLWHWETMVELKSGQNPIQFKQSDVQQLNVGFPNDNYLSGMSSAASQTISHGQSLLALQASIEMASKDKNHGTEGSARRWRSADFICRIPMSIALAASIVLFSRACNATSGQSSIGASTSASQDSSLGTLAVPAWIHLPQNVWPILVEWAALIPLTLYLSSSRSDFELAAEVSLRGRLSVGVIPKLWALGGIAKILRQGEVFFDSANATGETLKVFDVQHGSVFRCYNSGAAAAVAETAFGKGSEGDPEITEEMMLSWITRNKDALERDFGIAKYEEVIKGEVTKGELNAFEKLRDSRKIYGRRQILNIVYLDRDPDDVSANDPVQGTTRRPESPRTPNEITWLWFPEFLFNLAATVALAATGCFGSAALLFIGGISRVCATKTNIGRPPMFLCNRESYEGCMLVAVHDNAAVWTLFLGDRGIIDSLLNKPMIAHFHPTKISNFIHAWFRFAEILQVVAMTYVAGEKGWDGLMLLMMIAVVWVLGQVYGYNRHAAHFLKDQGYSPTAFGCEFPGRTELLGAVQLLSTQGRTIWMDAILAPCERRTVLLQKLTQPAADKMTEEWSKNFRSSFNALSTDVERSWMMSTWIQSMAGATLIKERLAQKKAETRWKKR